MMSFRVNLRNSWSRLEALWRNRQEQRLGRGPHPFWAMVSKEAADHIRSWRFNILLILVALTCLASLYSALEQFHANAGSEELDSSFVFLQLFTLSDGTLPSFITFIGFLGPLLGIGMGFDAINAEQNKGTLSRILAQPVHRDYIINAKFTASLIVVGIMFFALTMIVAGAGIITLGIPPTPSEFWRILFFVLLTVCYIAFWLNLSILFSVRFKQAATSALCAMAVWIFFSVFYDLVMRLVSRWLAPSTNASVDELVSYQEWMQNLMRISPNQLYSEGTTTLLMPSVRSLGPLTVEQVYGAIPSPLSLGQSLLLVWPQITGLAALTIVCFAISYVLFMRKEVRAR
ncbi:ABC transporter permease [Marinicrinis lubricantis]|uniref:ABC transporter permease n=1 Tax=Marinicrinis lubricantis TaxID=2086470 RepID=A0ABW1IQA2_9BACL